MIVCIHPRNHLVSISFCMAIQYLVILYLIGLVIPCSLQQLHLALIANPKKTPGLPEIVCHPPPKMMFLYHLQLRKAKLLSLQKTQMTIQNASSAWSNPKMPQLSTVTQDTAAVAGPVRRC